MRDISVLTSSRFFADFVHVCYYSEYTKSKTFLNKSLKTNLIVSWLLTTTDNVCCLFWTLYRS